jgi:hypothetical protein
MNDTCGTIARLKRLEVLLDRKFSVFGFRVGLDGLMGLVPGVGDLASAAFGAYLVFEARRLGASRLTLARMVANVAVDATLGSVPVVGDAFDFAFRSNTKNVRLLIRDLERRAKGLREARRAPDGGLGLSRDAVAR